MIRFFLIILAVLILLSMVGYAVYLWAKVKNQQALEQELRKQAKEEQKARFERIFESVEVIAHAVRTEQCNPSEGVLRLKPLLDVLGHKLLNYPAMWELYELVQDMAILEERKALKRNERMRQDLAREAKEAELFEQIQAECGQLIETIKTLRKAQ